MFWNQLIDLNHFIAPLFDVLSQRIKWFINSLNLCSEFGLYVETTHSYKYSNIRKDRNEKKTTEQMEGEYYCRNNR